MKMSKRHKNSVIIHLFLYTILLLILIYFSMTFFYSKIMYLEQQKITTKLLYKNIQKIKKDWITFEEFKLSSNNMEKSSYITEVLKNITKDFYLDNLINKDFQKFTDFLEDKKTKLNSEWVKFILDERNEKIAKILPSYSDNYLWKDNTTLTDFKFVNYIESLLETFNLSYSNPIWIKNLVLIEDFVSKNTNPKSLETNIFYIPIKLSLKGKKEWIINFLHYIENVWKIYRDEDDIKIYNYNNKDSFLHKNWKKIVLNWDNNIKTIENLENYNIYENQIIDIEMIKIDEYINSSNIQANSENFLEFIKNFQWNEKMKIELKLNFYVKWLPFYKLENFIVNTLDKYTILVKDVNLKMKDKKTKPHISQKLEKINLYLKEISKDIVSIKKSLKKKENLDDLYKKVINYNTIFDSYEKQLK